MRGYKPGSLHSIAFKKPGFEENVVLSLLLCKQSWEQRVTGGSTVLTLVRDTL